MEGRQDREWPATFSSFRLSSDETEKGSVSRCVKLAARARDALVPRLLLLPLVPSGFTT